MGHCTTEALGRAWEVRWTRRKGVEVSGALLGLLGEAQASAITRSIANAQAAGATGKDAASAILTSVLGASAASLLTSAGASVMNDLLDMVEDQDAVEELEPIDAATLAVLIAWDGGFFILGSPSRMSRTATQDNETKNPHPSQDG